MDHRRFFKLKALLADRNGNVAIIFALAAIPLFIALAASVDYARAAKARGELAAIADAAVLTGTTPTMMAQSTTSAKAAIANMFAAQAQQIGGLTYAAKNLTVDVTDTKQPNFTQRTVNLTYKAQVANAFGAFLAQAQTGFTVTASAATTNAPNIDFYMLVDNSPSMELPATTQGVSDMIAKTGCAFACHETNMADNESKGYPGYGTIDSYTFAENAGIALRIDNVRTAVNQVASTAQSTMTHNGATYRMAVYGFNHDFKKIQKLITTTTAHQNNIQNSVANLTPPLMASNNYIDGNQTYVYPTGASTYATVNLDSSPLYNNDAMTDFGYAMTKINAEMPTPGAGTSQTDDTPQGVLMIVTDGVVDAAVYSSSACSTSSYVPISNKYGAFTRCMAPVDTSFCATVKNRGIRIAVLNTTYQPVESDSWYRDKIKPFISQVASNLQACASSAALYHEVTTDEDISAALSDLFQKAVSTAPRLTN